MTIMGSFDTFLSIGTFSIKWYSILMVAAIMIAIYMITKEARKFDISNDYITNLLFWTIIFGIIGARIYYVIFNLDYYSSNISEILKIWEGGIAIHGAIFGGAIFILIYTLKYKVNTVKIFDIMAPALLLGQTIGRWGNFFNREAHGSITTISHLKSLHLPDFIINGMYINGNYYIPTFLYESLWNIIGVIILLIYRKFKYIKQGTITSIYLMWYSIGRFFVEQMRTDSLIFNDFRVAQIVSIILFIAGLIMFIICIRGSKLENLYKESENKNIKF